MPDVRFLTWNLLVVVAVVMPATPLCRIACADVAGPTIPPSILEVLPQESLVVAVSAGPVWTPAPGPATSALDLVTLAVDRAYELGLVSGLEDTVRAWMDALVALAEVMEHPNALVLVNVATAPRTDGGHELAALNAGLIFAGNEPPPQIARRIQHLLNTYTNSAESRLSREETDHGTIFTLVDSRLPEWAVIRWGPVKNAYAFTIGADAFRRLVEAGTTTADRLAAQSWFTSASAEARSSEASFSLYIDFDALRCGPDRLLINKVDEVQTALGLGGVEHGLWTFAYAGRGLEARAVLKRGERDKLLFMAGISLRDEASAAVIPDQANRYAVFDAHAGRVLSNLAKAYLAARSPGVRQELRAYWGELETKSGVSLDRDVFVHLGDRIVIHDYPQHPLRLPLARTILLRVAGDAPALRGKLDQFLGGVRTELYRTSHWRLHHDVDGVWYLQYGLLGPALVVTDDWVIISFSPAAVRRNVEAVQPASFSAEERTLRDERPSTIPAD